MPPLPDNGIVVGQTKLFDERSLALMLQGVQARLANRDFFDQGSIAAAIGKMQGARLDTSSFGLNVTTTPLPGTSTTINTGSTTTLNEAITQPTSPANLPTPFPNIVTTNNVVTPNTISQTITQPAVTPAAPALAAQPSTLAFQPSFGLAPQTLLAQQLELTHDLENYRLLLEGSLTDRIINARGTSANGGFDYIGPRMRAIAGFQISIDSLRRYENAVAEVEITVSTVSPVDPVGKNPPSVVMLLPQENNYNVATFTKDSKQFGFGVAVQPISFGLATQNQKETLYLVQDTDTVAFQRERPKTSTGPLDPKAVTLGWQFRPVLGQKTVKAGPRQVFAVLALPVPDGFAYDATVKATTHWRRYNSKTKAVGAVIDGSSSTQDLTNLTIPGNFVNGEPLQPIATGVSAVDAGQGNVLVNVSGSYFLPGTSVVLGNQIIDNAEKGFFLQGEKNFRWLVPGQQLASVDDALIVGRFGPPKELRDPAVTNPASVALMGRLSISNVTVTSLNAETCQMVVTVVHTVPPRPAVPPAPPVIAPPPETDLILVVGDKAYGFSDAPMRSTSVTAIAAGGASASRTYTLTAVVPARLAQTIGTIVVKRLFFGPRFRAEFSLAPPSVFTASKVTILSSGGGMKLGISGTGFTNDLNTKVVVDGTTMTPVAAPVGGVSLEWKDPTLLVLTLPDALSKTVKQIAVAYGNATSTILPVTAPAPPPPKPTVTNITPVNVNDQIYVTVAGTNLGSVDKVIFQGEVLKSKNLADDGTSMEVLVTKEMTDSAGRKAIDFVSKDGKEVSGVLIVRP
ncbi:MAG TPA: hypothetical protein VFI24_23560 [Pyrinomonadaceae bacterium]|nr:hypothetical protein [Pyrinomonadaceae bacterium]